MHVVILECYVSFEQMQMLMYWYICTVEDA